MNFVAEWTTMSAPQSRGATQAGCGKGGVYHQRDLIGVGHCGEHLEISYCPQGVCDDLGVEHFCGWRDGRGKLGGVLTRYECGVDAQPPQRHVKQGVGSAIERRCGNDVVTRAGQRGCCQELCRLSAGRGYQTNTALQRGDTFLERGNRGVANAAVDTAEFLEREQVGGIIGVFEDEARCLLDRDGSGPGGGIRLPAAVQRSGSESPLMIGHAAEPTCFPALVISRPSTRAHAQALAIAVPWRDGHATSNFHVREH